MSASPRCSSPHASRGRTYDGRRLAALLGADARDDDPAYAALGEPNVETCADQCRMTCLEELRIRIEREFGQWLHEARGQRKDALGLMVQHAHHRHAGRPSTVDQRLLVAQRAVSDSCPFYRCRKLSCASMTIRAVSDISGPRGWLIGQRQEAHCWHATAVTAAIRTRIWPLLHRLRAAGNIHRASVLSVSSLPTSAMHRWSPAQSTVILRRFLNIGT